MEAEDAAADALRWERREAANIGSVGIRAVERDLARAFQPGDVGQIGQVRCGIESFQEAREGGTILGEDGRARRMPSAPSIG